jgi:hypothetical protein
MQELRDLLVTKDKKVLQVLRDQLVPEEVQDLLDQLGLKGQQEQAEVLDLLDQQDLTDQMEPKDKKEK